MPTVLAACGGFLLAVLWMDLMFDVQVLPHAREPAELPESVLASIAAYYRRVTTTARPLGHLVGVVMLAAVIGIGIAVVHDSEARWIELASLPFAAGPIALAVVRVLPDAVRLGARVDSAAEQSRLARSICRDHLICFGAILVFVALQMWAAGR